MNDTTTTPNAPYFSFLVRSYDILDMIAQDIKNNLLDGEPVIDLDLIQDAKDWLLAFVLFVSGEEWWLEPHISLDEDGGIAFEWWSHIQYELTEKKLSVFIDADESMCIRSWYNQMSDGDAGQVELMQRHWNWMHSPDSYVVGDRVERLEDEKMGTIVCRLPWGFINTGYDVKFDDGEQGPYGYPYVAVSQQNLKLVY